MPRKIREISAVVSSVTPIWAMMIAVAPIATSPVAVIKARAILSDCESLLNASVRYFVVAGTTNRALSSLRRYIITSHRSSGPSSRRTAGRPKAARLPPSVCRSRPRADAAACSGHGRVSDQIQARATQERGVVAFGRRCGCSGCRAAGHLAGQQPVNFLRDRRGFQSSGVCLTSHAANSIRLQTKSFHTCTAVKVGLIVVMKIVPNAS